MRSSRVDGSVDEPADHSAHARPVAVACALILLATCAVPVAALLIGWTMGGK